jgi:YD repeat-containing protein
MRKIITLIVLFALIKGNAQGQIDYSSNQISNQISNPNILPPDVSSFQKVNFLPVSNYTGRANIDIPFYNIDLGGLSIPISLSYNTGGVKANDVASAVGLNWSLNAGGMISKIVKGVDDFYNFYMHYGGPYEGVDIYYDKRIGYLSHNNLTDTKDIPDLFKLNAPGVNLSFIHNRDKIDPNQGPAYFTPYTPSEIAGTNQNGQAVDLKDTDVASWDRKPFILDAGNDCKIEETYGDLVLGMFGREDSFSPSGGLYNNYWIDNFGSFNANYSRQGITSISVTSNNGYQYIFDKVDSSQYVLNRDNRSNATLTYGQGNPLGTQSVAFATNVNPVAYHLSKIMDLKTNKQVNFEYETYTQGFSEIIDNINLPVGLPGYAYVDRAQGLWQKYPKLNRLKKIVFEKGSVVFNYSLNREDLPGEKALTDITLFDNKNNQIKKLSLDFDYFQSLQETSSPYSKRLRLKQASLQGTDATQIDKYKLSYNVKPLPLRILPVTDAFGYYNGYADNFKYNIAQRQYVVSPPMIDAIPNPRAFFNPNCGQNAFMPVPISPYAIPIDGNYSLTADLSYCKAGILYRIDYPTGGYTTLDYELNSYQLNGYEVQGGGLRVKEQKISDGTTERTLKFDYTKADGTSSGALTCPAKYINFDYNLSKNAPLVSALPSDLTQTQFETWFTLYKTNFPKQNIELTEGSFIGYSRVKVYEMGKGYTLYEYTNPSSHPNTEADIAFSSVQDNTMHGSSFLNTNNYKKIYYDNGKLDLIFDNDVYRGKLLKEAVFNQQDQKLKETQYQYTEKLFKNLLLIKEIDESISDEQDCMRYFNTFFPDSGEYSYCLSKQYGYFKQRRFLLTNVVQNDYFNGSVVSKTRSIEYDNDYALIKKEVINDNLNTYQNNYYYSFDPEVQSENGMNFLNAFRRLSDKVKTISLKNHERLLEEKVKYGSNSQYKMWAKQIIKYKSGSINNVNEIKSSEATNWDDLGNILELTDVLGNKTAFIWGYNKTEIVAKIENVAYSTIQAGIISAVQTASNTGLESELVNQLNNLRSTLSANPNALITTFTYKPLIGVSTITDARKDKITYNYDSLGRLIAIRDKDNNIVSENQYHNKPQN